MKLHAADLLPVRDPGVEYTPYHLAGEGGGRADRYAAFLADHLRPAVDAVLRTRPDTFDGAGSETAWAERLPSAMAWLLRGYAVQPPAYVQEDLRALAAAEDRA